MCEVFTPEGEAHPTNRRATLRSVLDAGGSELGAWFGFEQEYTLFEGTRPLGWPEVGYPAPQGPFYCGVGSDKVYGREIVEAHTALCLKAGLMIFGTNAEVMPGQWEFQMGYRGVDGESADPLTVTDHLWFARWLLNRVGEDFGVAINYEVKPVKGDWNGAGAHTNFSTTKMRNLKPARKLLRTQLRQRKAWRAHCCLRCAFGRAPTGLTRLVLSLSSRVERLTEVASVVSTGCCQKLVTLRTDVLVPL